MTVKSDKLKHLIQIGLGSMLGVCVGILLIYAYIKGAALGLMLIFFVIAFIIQVGLHELGHLIGGLFSGYRFLSYRLFSLTLVSSKGKLMLTKQKVPGTLGQCLMIPPKNKDHFSFKLYIAGGVLMNLFVSLLSLVWIQRYPVYVMEFMMIGFLFLITNGLPNGFNDGSTYQIANSSKRYADLLHKQLEINAKMTKGATFLDFPKSYFEPVSIRQSEFNYFDDFQEFLQLGYLLELRDWKEIKPLIEYLWQRKENIILPYQLELKKELLFFLLINEKEDKRIEELIIDNQLKNYLKLNVISNYRIKSACQAYYFHDSNEALKLIGKGLEIREKTSNIGEGIVESNLLLWLQETLTKEMSRDR